MIKKSTDNKIELCSTATKEDIDFVVNGIIDYGKKSLEENKSEKRYCFLRKENGNLIGGGIGVSSLNMFFITHLYVEEKERCKGYGSYLLKSIEGQAAEVGCDLIRLNTVNERASSFYINYGYKVTVEISNYAGNYKLIYLEKKLSKRNRISAD